MGLPAVSRTPISLQLLLYRSRFTTRQLRENKTLNTAGKVVVLTQLGFIVLFVYGLSAEYHANEYQQMWILDNASPLQYFLNGYLAAGLIGILVGGIVLLVTDLVRERGDRVKTEV